MRFAELDLWGRISRPLVETVPPGWKLHRIGDLVEQVTTRVKVETGRLYNMTGVKWYGEGIFLRETVKGEDLSATYVCPVVPNALIYNRLFAWKGSFAVVPAEAKDQYVSNEFPQFVVNESLILPTYLYLYSLSKPVMEAVNRASAGSAAVSRNRLKEAAFLNIEIPLPPLATQQAIVERWQAARAAADAAMSEAAQVEREAAREFLHDLGLRSPEEVKTRKVFAMGWKDLERWGVSVNQPGSQLDIEASSFPIRMLGDLIADLENGWSPKCLDRPATPAEWGVLKVGAVSFGAFDETEN
ncbi:MAG: restriction endonuclease subunit S, partial [Sulfuricellaceae bacterium]